MARIIIDGYNLIRRSQSLSIIEAVNFERGRLELLKRLSVYREIKGHDITVVFDAANTDNVDIERDQKGGVVILYTQRGQSADEVIMDLARRFKGEAIIVTSDNEILKTAQKAGCGIIESGEFEKKVREALLYDDDRFRGRGGDESVKPIHKRWMTKLTKKKGPAFRLPKAKRRGMAKLS